MRQMLNMILSAYDAFDRALVCMWARLLTLLQSAWACVNRRLVPPLMRGWRAGQPRLVRLARRLGSPVARLMPRIPLGVGMTTAALLAAAIGMAVWRASHAELLIFLRFPDHDIARFISQTSILGLLLTIARLAPIVTLTALLAAVTASLRVPLALWLLQASAAGLALLTGTMQFLVWHAPGVAHAADPDGFPGHIRNEIWVNGTLIMLLLTIPTLLFLFVLILRDTAAYYRRGRSIPVCLGDRIWRNLVTHGRDPQYRRAQYWSIFLHLFLIIILPFLLTLWGCRMRPYGIPKGSGVMAVQLVQVQQQQEKQEERRYIFDMDTAISFYVPKIDDSEVFEEVAKLTAHTYTVQESGALGDGGGTTGGWPHGMEDARVRFIRLQYSGGSWDQNMGYGADYNMLLAFRQITGFNIWHETESIRIADLRRFPRRRAPPFVYLAGGYQGGMNLSNAEIRTLRHYCLDMGGMLFADNGGGRFNQDFRSAMQQIFPDLPLVEIPHDDGIFQAPFRFPNGAPPLWHISGTQAMGVRHRGRWVVFYHQGNMGAAWRDGHSDAADHVVAQAYQMGINLIAYSFTQYMRINFGGSIPR